MKQQLTKREKILLFSVGLIAILYFSIQFAILPLATRYNNGVNERERLTIEKETHDMEAATLPALRTRNEQVNADFDELTNGYPNRMPNEEIDRILTSLCTRLILSPTSLRFAPRDPPPPPPPEPTQPDTVRYDAQGTEEEEEEPAPVAPRPVFTKATAFMNVNGSYQSLLRLLDEVNSIEYIRLTNVGFQGSRLLGMQTPDSTISLTFEITMLYD